MGLGCTAWGLTHISQFQRLLGPNTPLQGRPATQPVRNGRSEDTPSQGGHIPLPFPSIQGQAYCGLTVPREGQWARQVPGGPGTVLMSV